MTATISLILAMLPLVPAAQGPAASPAARRGPPDSARTIAAPLTATDLSAFLDGAIPQQLQREDIAGAVVIVVRDGKVLFSRGYGWANVKARTPVTVDATLFRIGSISKTFMWTAVMQLAEQGKIDLDRDVNAYLDFTIPAVDGTPVTMKNLMTHTAGFEETVRDLFVSDTSDLTTLDVYLKSHLPRQIFAPGTTPAYSNYGAALAAHIVERVSGMPFDDYVEQHILRPLGMARASFRQPLPDALAPLMSAGYALASDTAKDFELIQVWPAGSAAATAEAMSHWMIAHLNDGAYGSARVLQATTARQMHSRLLGLVPALNGMSYGFYEESRNGHRIIGHGGDTQWFHSDMHLMVDDGIGFFISYNSAGKGETSPRAAIWRAFLDRYFPYSPPPLPVVATARADARTVAGAYETSRRAQTSVFSAAYLLQNTMVVADTDGTIRPGSRDFGGNLKRFEEVGPLLFREVHGQDRVAFVRDTATGRLRMVTDLPIAVADRVPVRRNAALNRTALMFGLTMFALTLVSVPLNALLRRHYGSRPELSPAFRRARRYVRLAMLANVVFVVFWLQSFGGDGVAAASSNRAGIMHAMQILGAIGALGILPAMMLALRSWREPTLWLWARVWNTALAAGFVCYVAFVLNGHLLAYGLRF